MRLSSFVIWLLLRIVFCSSHVVLTVWCFFLIFFKCVFTWIELHHFPSSPSSLHQPPAPLSQIPAVLPQVHVVLFLISVDIVQLIYSSGKGPLGAQWETLPAKLLWACVGLCSHSSQETISKILRRCVFHFLRNWLLFKVAVPFYTLPVVWSPVCSTFSPAFGAVSFTCGLIYSPTDIRHLFIHLLLYSVPFLMKLTIQTFCLLAASSSLLSLPFYLTMQPTLASNL